MKFVVPPLGGRVLRMCVTNSFETFIIESVILLLRRGESVHEKRSFRLGEIPPKGGTTNFSFLALADSIHRSNRAAPLPRQVSPGMGSGVGIPRRTAGTMGQARLAEQTRIAVAESRRVLGRAVAAASTMGGRNDSGLALWRANAAQKQSIHGGSRALARAGDRS